MTKGKPGRYGEFELDQPLFTKGTCSPRAQLEPTQGTQRTWFSGVFTRGSGHHED